LKNEEVGKTSLLVRLPRRIAGPPACGRQAEADFSFSRR